MNADIYITEDHNNFCIKTNIDGKYAWREVGFKKEQFSNENNPIFFWLLNAVKPIFDQMPMDKISFHCPEKIYKKHKIIIRNCAAMLNITNDKIKNRHDLKGILENKTCLLFWNIADNPRYKALYDGLKKVRPDSVYMTYKPGYDQKKRDWGEAKLPMPIEDLVDFMQAKSIGTVISINHYVLDKYLMETGTNLMTLLEFMGIKWIIIDNDPPDLRPCGYLGKAFYNNPTWPRFSNLSLLNRYWDERYGMSNVQYVAIPQSYADEHKGQLQEAYSIVILTNSRLRNIESMRSLLDIMLDKFSEETLYTDVQLWYLATRRLVLEIMELTELERLQYNSMLHNLFYAMVNYLKHKIIDQISTKRQIEIYGDEGWQKLCPEYYKGLLNNDGIKKLYAENNHLYLLLNFSFSYLDASGPVYDAIAEGIPFINVPPLVKARGFEGFKYIEYSNPEEMNYLIETAPKNLKRSELRDSIRLCKKTLNSSNNSIKNGIFGENRDKIFSNILAEHQIIIDKMVDDYLSENEGFIRQAFYELFVKINWRIDESRHSKASNNN